MAEACISCFLRIRPSKIPSDWFVTDETDRRRLHFSIPSDVARDYVNNSRTKYSFTFEDVMGMRTSQDEVFNKVGKAAVENALQGYNSTVFAYGQTGSGKTFTITGGAERYADRGIIPRAIQYAFAEIAKRSDIQFKMYISYLEIYNDRGYDLLDPSHETKSLEDLPRVYIQEDEQGNYHLKNLSMHLANNEEDALSLLFLGDTNRAIAETPMNQASSRSHCIFTIAIEAREVGTDKVRRSKVHLVDLAGSERVNKTHTEGQTLQEAKYINTSLFYLENVIMALHEKATKGRTHVPYRNSMMTSVLRDSLGGNCKTVMIATINPEREHTEESISTCRFATRVALVKNTAYVNEDIDPTLVIRRLKNEIGRMREEIAFLKGDAGEGEALSDEDLADLKQRCLEYVSNADSSSHLDIGTMSLVRIQSAFSIFKQLVIEARASGSKLPNGDGDIHGGGHSADGSNELALQKEIEDLRSCLEQRDNELKILVGMVKQGKAVAGQLPAARSIPHTSLRADYIQGAYGNRASMGSHPHAPIQNDQQPAMVAGAPVAPVSLADSKYSPRTPQTPKSVKPARQPPMPEFVHGVLPPSDSSILADPQRSFEYFMQRLQGSEVLAPIEANKQVLKEKMTAAKALGEKANAARNSIQYLRKSIEIVRKEKAVQNVLDGSDPDGVGDGKRGDNDEPQSEPSDAMDDEEARLRQAIEAEKEIYRSSFTGLRELKSEIEHIQMILEKSRAKLQQQFDRWYQTAVRYGPPALAEAKAAVAPQADTLKSPATASLPDGLPLTGNKEVDEDILAFYRAKEELLQARQKKKDR